MNEICNTPESRDLFSVNSYAISPTNRDGTLANYAWIVVDLQSTSFYYKGRVRSITPTNPSKHSIEVELKSVAEPTPGFSNEEVKIKLDNYQVNDPGEIEIEVELYVIEEDQEKQICTSKLKKEKQKVEGQYEGGGIEKFKFINPNNN